MNTLQRNSLFILLYAIACLVIYYQTKDFGTCLDDDLIIDAINAKIVSIKDLPTIFKERYNRAEYRPIPILTYGIEYLLFDGFNNKTAHLINVFFYFSIVCSLFYAFNNITQRKYTIQLFLAILLFTVHPLNTEVVASIKSRDGLLSMLCSIWSIFFLVKADSQPNKKKYNILALILFIIGLFCKLDTLGILLFILSFYLIKFNKKQFITGVILFVVYFFTFFILRDFLINNILPIQTEDSDLARTTFTENPLYLASGIFKKILMASQTNLFYLSKAIVPKNLCYYYGYNAISITDRLTFSSAFSLFINIGFAVFFILNGIKRNKVYLLFFFGYISLVFYALNYVTPVAGIIADRYIFMALPWLLALITFFLFDYLSINPKIPIAICIIWCTILLILAYQRTKAWSDELTLIETDAPKLSQSYEGMRIASSIYYENYTTTKDSTLLNKAISCALNANKIYPKNTLMNTQLGQFYFNLGEYDKSETYLLKALQVDSTNSTIFYYLGDVYYIKKEPNIALKNYQKAYYYSDKIKNKNMRRAIVNNISTIYYEKGLLQETLNYNLNLIKEDSTAIAPFENLGYFYSQQKNNSLANYYFNKAIANGMPKEEVPAY